MNKIRQMADTGTHLPTDIRKEQIKKAVLDIVFSEGLKKLSTHNLAQKVGLSEGAIFRHFKTKQDIILSIIEDVKTGVVEDLKAISLKNISPDKKLKKFICTHITFLQKNKGITLLLFTEASYQNDEKLKNLLNEIFQQQRTYFQNIISEGYQKGVWKKVVPAEDLATLYIGIPVSMNIENVLSKSRFSYQNFCDRVVGIFNKILTN